MTQKDIEQGLVTANYIREGPYKCTIVYATGVGKSKVAIDILKHKMPPKVIILVNSKQLKDYNWKDEFKRWKFLDFYEERVEMETYQTAYKWDPNVKDLSDYYIIADEIDFAADVPEYSKFFYNYTNCNILGLTGFITDSKLWWFKTYMPIFAELSADEAQEKKILNNIHFIFVKYDLSKNPTDYEVEYSKHGVPAKFQQSENAAYDYAHRQYTNAIISKEVNNDAFMRDEITYEDYLKEIRRTDYLIKRTSSKRSDLLLNSIAAKNMTKKLLNYINKNNPDDKTIVFSKRTAHSIEVCGKDRVYNGALTDKQNANNFEAFQKGDIKVLGVVDKINRGANMKGLTVGILNTFYGSDTKAVQKFGRMLRLSPDDVATVYIFLPYFLRKTTKLNKETDKKEVIYVCTETQQVLWAAKMLRSTNVKSKEVWDYRAIKTDD